MKQTATKIHTGLAWFIFIGSNVQFVLIALAFFGGAGLQLHTSFGGILMLSALLLLIAALVSRRSMGNVVVSLVVLLALVPIQGLLVRLDLAPALRSLHAANGLLIMWLSYALARGRFRATISKEAAIPVTVD